MASGCRCWNLIHEAAYSCLRGSRRQCPSPSQKKQPPLKLACGSLPAPPRRPRLKFCFTRLHSKESGDSGKPHPLFPGDSQLSFCKWLACQCRKGRQVHSALSLWVANPPSARPGQRCDQSLPNAFVFPDLNCGTQIQKHCQWCHESAQ